MSAAEARGALKPCPFCGGADIRRDDHGFPVSFACEDCGARGGASEESLRDGVELARPFGTREFFGCVLLGAVIGATMAALL